MFTTVQSVVQMRRRRADEGAAIDAAPSAPGSSGRRSRRARETRARARIEQTVRTGKRRDELARRVARGIEGLVLFD